LSTTKGQSAAASAPTAGSVASRVAQFAQSRQTPGMQGNNMDSILMIVILAGIALSILNLILSVVNGRSSRMAEVKATAGLKELYQRTYQRGRRLVSITRSGKLERRKTNVNRVD
jgi:hypothetical protein